MLASTRLHIFLTGLNGPVGPLGRALDADLQGEDRIINGIIDLASAALVPTVGNGRVCRETAKDFFTNVEPGAKF